MFETDLDGAVEEAIVLSGSVEKTFGVGSEDLMMRRMLSHALMFRCLLLLLLLAVVTGQGGGHRHRCRSHDFNPPFCFVFLFFQLYIKKYFGLLLQTICWKRYKIWINNGAVIVLDGWTHDVSYDRAGIFVFFFFSWVNDTAEKEKKNIIFWFKSCRAIVGKNDIFVFSPAGKKKKQMGCRRKTLDRQNYCVDAKKVTGNKVKYDITS